MNALAEEQIAISPSDGSLCSLVTVIHWRPCYKTGMIGICTCPDCRRISDNSRKAMGLCRLLQVFIRTLAV